MISIADGLIIILTFIYVLTTIFIGFYNQRLLKLTSQQISLTESQMRLALMNFEEQIRLNNIPLLEISFNYIKKELSKDNIYEFLIDKNKECKEYVTWQFNLLMKNIGIGLANSTSIDFEILDTSEKFSSKIDQHFIKVGDSIERAFILKSPSFYDNGLSISNFQEDRWRMSYPVKITFNYQDVIGNKYRRDMIVELISYPYTIKEEVNIQVRDKVQLGELSNYMLVERANRANTNISD